VRNVVTVRVKQENAGGYRLYVFVYDDALKCYYITLRFYSHVFSMMWIVRSRTKATEFSLV